MNTNPEINYLTVTPRSIQSGRQAGPALLLTALAAVCLLVFAYSICRPADQLELLSEGWKKHSDGRPMYYGVWKVKHGDDWEELKLPGGRDAVGVYTFKYQALGRVYFKSRGKTYTHKPGLWWEKRTGATVKIKVVGQPEAKITVFFIPGEQKPAKPKPKPKSTPPPLKVTFEDSYYDNFGHIVYLKEIKVNDVKRWHSIRFTHDDRVGFYRISWTGPGQIEAKDFSGKKQSLAQSGQWYQKLYGFKKLKFKVLAKSGFACTVYYHPNECTAGG